MAHFSSVPFITIITVCYLTCTTLILASPGPGPGPGPGRTNALINQVCKNTTDSKFCEDVIYSDPRAAKADRDILAYIAYGRALLNATATSDFIVAALKSAPAGRKAGSAVAVMRKCEGYYRNAVNVLEEMWGDLDSETYYELDKRSTEVEDDARACHAAALSGGVGSGEVVTLAQRSWELAKLANICYVVSKLYPYGG